MLTFYFLLNDQTFRISCRDVLVGEIATLPDKSTYHVSVIGKSNVSQRVLADKLDMVDKAWPKHPAVEQVENGKLIVGPVSTETDPAMVHAMLGIIRSAFIDARWYWGNDLIALRLLHLLNPEAAKRYGSTNGPTNYLTRRVEAATLFETAWSNMDFVVGDYSGYGILTTMFALMVARPAIPPLHELTGGKKVRDPGPGRTWYNLLNDLFRDYPASFVGVPISPAVRVPSFSLLAFHFVQKEIEDKNAKK